MATILFRLIVANGAEARKQFIFMNCQDALPETIRKRKILIQSKYMFLIKNIIGKICPAG
jgi:hypothetical protein